MNNNNNNPVAELTEFALKALFSCGYIALELLREKRCQGSIAKDSAAIQSRYNSMREKVEQQKK